MRCRVGSEWLLAWLVWAALVSAAGPVRAGDLTSPSFRMRGAAESSVGARSLASAGPRFSASGASLGQADAIGFSSGASSLTTAAPGFWPIAAGALPHHDVDGDGVASWVDTDDDGDGLSDATERDTRVFASASDPGTSAVLFDTDGDGFGDGVEVAQGSDPNDADSTPGAAEIPLLPDALIPLLAVVLAIAPRALRRTRRSTC